MDKHNARFNYTLKSIEGKLNVMPIVTQTPIGQGKTFQGFVDLPSLNLCLWREQELLDKSWGSEYTTEPLDQSKHGVEVFEKSLEARATMIDQLCEFDEKLSDTLLESESYDKIGAESTLRALRNVTLNNGNDAIVTMCGSAYKNIGIQPLMDAIILFLPKPTEIHHPFLNKYFK